MKILFISPYREASGWSTAGINYILAADSIGLNVVPRCLKLNNEMPSLPKKLLDLESKSSNGCDVVIQHVLPHMMRYDGNFKKNIGLFVSETSNFQTCNWAEHLNLMDEVWVPNAKMVDFCKVSGVIVPIQIVPHAIDTSKFERNYEEIREIRDVVGNDFVFYTIGECTKRKNLESLLKAFHTEFDPEEPVQLVIKANKYGEGIDEVRNYVNNLCGHVKNNLKLYRSTDSYKKEIVVADFLKEENVYRLHNTCDSFVTTSYGEAWSYPTCDALGFGKAVIAPSHSGFLEYLNQDCAFLVENYPDIVFGVTDTFFDLFTGNEYWWQVDLRQLKEVLRLVYNNKELRRTKSARGIERVYDFSHQNIGNLIKNLLNA